MICFQLRFPLGVFHGLAPRSERVDGAEWPPSPVRLIGGLLAAAHEVPSDDLGADRAVLQRLCEARPPAIHAPHATLCHEQPPSQAAGPVVAELRGASRWAPRNQSMGELKGGLSPRIVGRTRTEVDKSGVAIGSLPVTIVWPDIESTPEELRRLQQMAANVAWLGTSRSPVLITVLGHLPDTSTTIPVWTPAPWGSSVGDVTMRVPTIDLIDRFDAAYDRRRSLKERVEPSGHQRPANAGQIAFYEIGDRTGDDTFDPRHWGRIAIVAIDEAPAGTRTPRTPVTYVLARAVRAALLDAYGPRGSDGEAPMILHGHGDVAHLAVVPLPMVGPPYGNGAVRGIGLVFPHRSRCSDVDAQAATVTAALRVFYPDAAKRKSIRVPNLGELWIRPLVPQTDRLWALRPARYSGPAQTWTTVTPVIHSRWQKRSDLKALGRQVQADCSHVGLPAPAGIELLRAPGVRGGANRLLPPSSQLREEWRRSIQGPSSHLRLTFEQPVRGPILLGRARHFGIGLCVPDEQDQES